MLKITGKHQKLIIMGTQQEYQTWTRRFGAKITNVTLMRAKNADVFRSKHSRTTKVLILSDPDGLLRSSKTLTKVNKLQTIKREVFEDLIIKKYNMDQAQESMMVNYFGTDKREVVGI